MTEKFSSVEDIAEALAREEVEANRNEWSDRDLDELYFAKLLNEDLAEELAMKGATVGKDGRVIRPSIVIH